MHETLANQIHKRSVRRHRKFRRTTTMMMMASDVIVTTYRVGYLGVSPAVSNATGLAMVQQPLRELYLGKTTKFGVTRDEVQRPRSLEITSFGLAVKYEEMRTKTGNIVEVTEMLSPFPTIMLWAAVRFSVRKVGKNRKKKLECAFVPLVCSDMNLEASMFAPLDNKFSFVTKVKHPALFTCVLKHPESPSTMDCHAFICRNHADALEIAWNLHEALMQYTKIRKLTRNSSDSGGSYSRNSFVPLVSPNGRIQRVGEPIRSSLSNKNNVKCVKKNTVAFADVCTESSGRGSGSSGTNSPADSEDAKAKQKVGLTYDSEFNRRAFQDPKPFRSGDSKFKNGGSLNSRFDPSEDGEGLLSPTKTSDVPSSRDSTSTKDETSDVEDVSARRKVFGGIRVLPPGRPPSRPSSCDGGPDILSNIPLGESLFKAAAEDDDDGIVARDSKSRFRDGMKKEAKLDLPAENLSKRIYREQVTKETKTTVKTASKSKFPMIKLKKWRQRDSSLERNFECRDVGGAKSVENLASGSSSMTRTEPKFERINGVYQDGDSWKKYYWKDNRDLDLEKTMYSADWDVRKFNRTPENRRTNPHIQWSKANLERSLGYIP